MDEEREIWAAWNEKHEDRKGWMKMGNDRDKSRDEEKGFGWVGEGARLVQKEGCDDDEKSSEKEENSQDEVGKASFEQ